MACYENLKYDISTNKILIESFNFFLLAWVAFVIGAVSSRPSTLLIASTSMAHGRWHGLAVAAGIMTGSLVWGTLAASGSVILLITIGWLAEGPQYAAGICLLYLAWLAAVTVGTPYDAPAWHDFMIVISCKVLGVIIFGGYAVLFATDSAQHIYHRAERWIDGFSALIFGALGVGLLLRRT